MGNPAYGDPTEGCSGCGTLTRDHGKDCDREYGAAEPEPTTDELDQMAKDYWESLAAETPWITT